MDAIKDVPVNYRGNGTWYFEADIKSGHYQLELVPHLFLYSLLLPNGKKIEGTIPTLMSKMEHYHQDPELSEWILNALSWKERANNFDAWRKQINFEVARVKYRLTINARTGQVDIYVPSVIYVAPRRYLGTLYPEIYGIKNGALSELISSVLANEGIDGSEDEFEEDEMFLESLCIDAPKIYEIEGWQVWLDYNPATDVLFLYLSDRTINSSAYTLARDMAEFTSLHDGQFQEKVVGILSDEGFMDVQL